MKCSIPEISWHNREPVLSVDIFASGTGDFYRLATGGSDTLILIWQLKIVESGAVDIDILSELTRHQKAVNVVRWSPNGDYLASGDDDANIIIWQLKTDNIPLLEGDNNNKETWIVHKILRCHKEDVYDICWAPNGAKLLSGSVDNTAILWDLNKGKSENILTDHKGFVQGVAWDPKNDYIATLSSDRICRLFHASGKQVRARIGRGVLPVEENHNLYNKEVKYFHDDTFKTFFRRLNFSPDGNLLLVPSGCVETEDCKTAMYATYIFTLDSLKQPAIILPTATQCSIVVRCSPVLYELRPNGPKPYIDLPYRMIIAVATDSDVILYDTQQQSPFAHMQKIHYTRMTDLAWSNDGLLLAASSTDGFITLVTFENQELGVVYKKEESEHEEVEKLPIVEEPVVEEKVKTADVKQKRSSFIEQWAKQGPKRKAEDEPVFEAKKIRNDEVIIVPDSPVKAEPSKTLKKRITPITLKSVTPKKVKRNDDTKETKVPPQNTDSGGEQPKTPKRAQLVTLRIGSTKKSESVEATGSKQTTDGSLHNSANTKDGPSMETEKNDDATTKASVQNKNEAAKDENSKPKKRAQLIKIGECSKSKKSPAPKETTTALENSLITKLKFALNKPAVDKEENIAEEKENNNLDDKTNSKEESSNSRNQIETIKEKEENVPEKEENINHENKTNSKEKSSKDNSRNHIETVTEKEENVLEKEENVPEKEENINPENKTNSKEKSGKDNSRNHIGTVTEKEENVLEKEENINPETKTNSKEKSDKGNSGKHIECINIEEDTAETIDCDKIKEEKRISTARTIKKVEKPISEIEQISNNKEMETKNAATSKKIDNETIDNAASTSNEKCTTSNQESDTTTIIEIKSDSENEETKMNEGKKITKALSKKNSKNAKKTRADEDKTEVVDVDKPSKKAPKRTPIAKKTPKVEDKLSPGRGKKKQSTTPKVSLLNFFKPISSETKTKTESNEEKEGANLNPKALFKNKNEGELVIIEDSNSEDGLEVLKVKTSALFKSKKTTSKKSEMTVNTTSDCKTAKSDSNNTKKEKENKNKQSPKRTSKAIPIIEPKTVELLEEDTVPDDFTLQIEETMDVDPELKENKVEELKPEKPKQPQRVPLITLASPKGKKKRADT